MIIYRLMRHDNFNGFERPEDRYFSDIKRAYLAIPKGKNVRVLRNTHEIVEDIYRKPEIEVAHDRASGSSWYIVRVEVE